MLTQNPMKQVGLYLADKFLAHSIEVVLRNDGAEDSLPLARLAKEEYDLKEPSNESLAMARAFIDDPNIMHKNKESHPIGINLHIHHVLKDRYISEELLGLIMLFAISALKAEGLIKSLPYDENAQRDFLAPEGEEVEVEVIIMNDFTRYSAFKSDGRYPVLAQSINGHHLFLNGKDFHPEIGAKITISGKVTGFSTSESRKTTQLVDVKTIKCPYTGRFIRELSNMLADVEVSDEFSYDLLRKAVTSLEKKYFIESSESLLVSYSHILDPKNNNIIVPQVSINEHSNFYFDLSELMKIKKIVQSNGEISFIILE